MRVATTRQDYSLLLQSIRSSADRPGHVDMFEVALPSYRSNQRRRRSPKGPKVCHRRL